MPDPRQLGSAKSLVTPTSLSRGSFSGWWSVLRRFAMSTEQCRNIGGMGIPGACVGTLTHQLTGLTWRILTEEGDETEETRYYELLLDQARDTTGAVIGFERFLGKGAGDILCANEGWNYEIFRVPKGRYAGVPVNLIYIDAAELEPTNDPEQPVQQVLPSGQKGPVFREEEIGRAHWEGYNKRGLEFYNRNPIIKSYVALAMLTAEDDYTYDLLTQVVPQGALNLGTGFDRVKALEWKSAWDQARRGGKLEDIVLLYGTDGAGFIPFSPPPADMPFQHAGYWYLTMVTANFEMSPFDLGYMTQINTKAGSEATVELSRNKGLRHLLTQLKRSIERNVLPDGLELRFPDLDPTDEEAESAIREANTRALMAAAGGPFLTKEEARAEAVRLRAYEVDPSAPPPEDPAAQQDDREEARKMQSHVAKAEQAVVPETGSWVINQLLTAYGDSLAMLIAQAINRDIEREVFIERARTIVTGHAYSAYATASDMGLEQIIAEGSAELHAHYVIHDEAITQLADAIYGAGEDEAFAWLPGRLFLWSVALLGLMNQGRARGHPEQRYRFRLGATRKHCEDCLRLAGQVHTGAQWLASGLLPQSRELACGGWQCDCWLDPTEDAESGDF